MIYDILIIGFGSIGKRHFSILRKMPSVRTISIVTKQNIDNELGQVYKSINDVGDFDQFSYFVIANESEKHFDSLSYLNERVEDRLILVEKPLFAKNETFISNNNSIFVGYNLRFHPIIAWLKKELLGQSVLYATVKCGQYLPTWRPNTDYSKCYSAKKNGGGVTRDLSHEIDYCVYLFGFDQVTYSDSEKLSDLDIESEDMSLIVGCDSNSKCKIIISLDYISKITTREMSIHTNNKTYKADFIKNKITIGNINSIQKDVVFEPIDRDYTYTAMHNALLNNNNSMVCSLAEGLKVNQLISSVLESK